MPNCTRSLSDGPPAYVAPCTGLRHIASGCSPEGHPPANSSMRSISQHATDKTHLCAHEGLCCNCTGIHREGQGLKDLVNKPQGTWKDSMQEWHIECKLQLASTHVDLAMAGISVHMVTPVISVVTYSPEPLAPADGHSTSGQSRWSPAKTQIRWSDGCCE